MRVCAHEIDHVIQCQKAGDLGYSWGYITNPAQRAYYEAEAYRCEMELEYRYFGRILDPWQTAFKLLGYGCSAVDVETARKMLGLSIPTVKDGGIVEPAAREAIVWLDERFRWAA
jgi:hypothetical protein